ncbi:MAG: hypothetical protein ACRDRA_17685 [Pseudonocardiaceae bacterium]
MTGSGRFEGLRARVGSVAGAAVERAMSVRPVGAAEHEHEPERGESEIRAWVAEALSRVPMPDAPVREPWVLAPSALIAAHLPGPLAQVLGLLDRFGAIRLAPHEIGIDTARPVPWKDVVEVRTLPLLELVTTRYQQQCGRSGRAPAARTAPR